MVEDCNFFMFFLSLSRQMLRYKAYIDYATIVSFQVLFNSLFIRHIIVRRYTIYILKASECNPFSNIISLLFSGI
jgi:hypothetical protein